VEKKEKILKEFVRFSWKTGSKFKILFTDVNKKI